MSVNNLQQFQQSLSSCDQKLQRLNTLYNNQIAKENTFSRIEVPISKKNEKEYLLGRTSEQKSNHMYQFLKLYNVIIKYSKNAKTSKTH